MRTPFPAELREAGANLLDELDRQKYPAKAAFWLYASECDDWSLVIATPRRRVQGPLKSYKSLQQVLRKVATPIPLSSIMLLDTKDSLIRSLAKAVGNGPRVSGMRFFRSPVGGHFIEDAYIYRMAS